VEDIHLLDYDLKYDVGLRSTKNSPNSKSFLSILQQDTQGFFEDTQRFFEFADLESGSMMALHVAAV
jgi:hypothetical protein